MNTGISRHFRKLILVLAAIFLISFLLYMGYTRSIPPVRTHPFTTSSKQAIKTTSKSPSSPLLSPTPPGTTLSILPTSTRTPNTVWIHPDLPRDLREKIQVPDDLILTTKEDRAHSVVGFDGDIPVGHWTYVLVSPFPSLTDKVSFPTIKAFWDGESPGLYDDHPLYLSEETLGTLSAWWGKPDPDSVTVVSKDQILESVWPDPQTWAILPFEQLEPRWKVITVNNQNPLDKNFMPQGYPLSLPVTFTGTEGSLRAFTSVNESLANRDPRLMTHLIMTGVTAMVRDTAALMEEKGITYPAQQIGDILRGADYTHISNEVPFAENCPPPESGQQGLFFCSDDRYIQLLEYIGTDIVELSGDHFGDWGAEAMFHTLDLYKDRGWLTYGGGKNYRQGLQPIRLEHNGNKIAFIGCNAKAGEKYATATDTEPGASRCDFTYMKQKIEDLKAEGFLPIATMQHDEIYQFEANYLQQRDFRYLAESGAVIVSGSQAHQPQAMEFHEGSFIHYGLGNLFFDQYYLAQYVEKYKDSDKAFIDLHIFYEKRHLSTRLITIQFVDNAQPRLMTVGERRDLLESVFQERSW